MIQIKRTDSENKDFIELVQHLDGELAERDGEDHSFYAQFNKIDKIKHVLVAYENSTPIACGAIKEYASDTMEVKRMYTAPESRGKGMATKILSELEKWAGELSYKKCILETGKRQAEAIELYKKSGYHLIPNYGQYAEVENSLCFEKEIKKLEVKDQFDKVSKAYDSQRKKLIPCYDDFYGVSIENLELKNPQPKILDLGAGTGLFSQMVLEKYSEAKIDLVDLSEKMLEIAAERFKNHPNVSIIKADYTKRSFPGDYDAIISSLSIHHLEDVDKIELYRKIFNWLKPGGIFINAEQVLGNNLYFENLYRARWKAKVESTDLRKDEIESAYERVKLDKRTPLTVQLAWLEEVGFKYVDCLYKYYDFVVIWAKKID